MQILNLLWEMIAKRVSFHFQFAIHKNQIRSTMSGTEKRKGNGGANTNSPAKKQKPSKDEEIIITDREMEDVLEDLSDEKLVQVVKRNNRLLPFARRIIERRYCYCFLEVSNKIEPESNEFLKLFGSEITHLKLIYHEKYRHFDQTIEKAIFDHCTHSLHMICFENASQFSMFEINEPFTNVTCVEIDNGTICSPFSNIGKWFPKLRMLELTNLMLHSTPDDKIFGYLCCPELTNLFTLNLKSENGDNVYMGHIARLVQQSPKLEFIGIRNQDNADELLGTIAEMNPNLPKVNLNLYLDKPVGAKAIHFESLERLEMNTSGRTLDLSADQIEKLYFCGDYEKCLKLLENNKNVHCIKIIPHNKVTTEFINLVKTLPALENLWIKDKLTTEQIMDLVSSCSTLEDAEINWKKSGEQPSNEDIQKSIFDSLHPEWQWECLETGEPPYFVDGYEFRFKKVNV